MKYHEILSDSRVTSCLVKSIHVYVHMYVQDILTHKLFCCDHSACVGYLAMHDFIT